MHGNDSYASLSTEELEVRVSMVLFAACWNGLIACELEVRFLPRESR